MAAPTVEDDNEPMPLPVLALCLSVSPLSVSSPDGRLTVDLAPGRLTYEVKMDGQAVLAPSRLGLGFADGSEFGERAEFLRSERRSHRGEWEDAFGTDRRVKDRWNEIHLSFADTGRNVGVIARVYDDGVAIRYELPGGGYTISDDETEFRFPGDSPAWGGEFSSCAEVGYPETRLSQFPQKNACLPVVVKTPSTFVAISEADLLDWSGMFIRRSGPTCLRASMASSTVGTGPRLSPWRVLMVGRTAADLVATNLIKNLAQPSRLNETAWIEPGISAWDPWWTGQNPTQPQFKGLNARGDTAADKRYIDLASEMGWRYQLVDWFWYDMGSSDPATATKPVSSVDIPELFRYAKSKGVRLFLWVHSNDVKKMGADKLFAVYQKWGAAGVKIDFMNSDDQETVRWYEETLAAAARHHLMVDFHGAYKPTGLARTYPNYITQEGVLGNEYNKLPGERFNPHHMITLPFTRGLLGPADVTPAGFLNLDPANFRTNAVPTQTMGSRCRQLSLAVLMTSPFLCLCDAPENYRGQPGAEFLRGLPTVWDESRVLQADFAKSLVIARRKGRNWWLAAMNDTAPLTLRVPLKFLGNGQYRLETFADGAGPADVKINSKHIRKQETLTIPMASAGGFVARFSAE